MSPAAPCRRGRLVASAAALCLLLAGCAGPETTPVAAPAPQPAPGTTSAPAPASPSPSAEPTASASRSAEEWSREEAVEEYWAEGAETSEPSTESGPEPEPEPTEDAEETTPSSEGAAPSSSDEEPDAAAPEAGVLPAAVPTRVRVPSVDVDSPLLELGLQEDGTVEVPPTGEGSPAGWYRNSPTPGERGPAILLGHVGNAHGRLGVFGRLEELGPGDVVEVDREDGTTAVFTVDRAVSYERADFPKDEVYGNTDDAQLRLITCEDYSAWTGRWEANHVVYARLTG
ncbi:class F sortase [Micrococcus lacusdianchii]|uniref:class F sortase n=1 Tax=Micrococcus lacusdianchii TaxID=2915940 RepID=UPI0020042625|nr:class F sortase [Micrococcus sp. JXJ CY 30]